MGETALNITVKLEQYQLIEVIGADAEKYLQGQLTCDVAKLTIGQQTLTCHCDPKGKMSSLFRLYRQDSERFFILIRRELQPEALVQLRKYAVFSKVSFNELDTPIFATTSGQIFTNFCENLTACGVQVGENRYLMWGGELAAEGGGEIWDHLDIQAGIPILHKANQFELIPQATNLQQLDQAISFTKGCYIGQETVARAKYRGANKRAMFTFVGDIQGQALPDIAGSIEMQIGENWKSTGLILALAVEGDRLWLQVVLNKEQEDDALFRVGGIALQRFPLPYALDEQ